jgi:mannose-6-phosphate isomerase-like protein (cupin superfamily)
MNLCELGLGRVPDDQLGRLTHRSTTVARIRYCIAERRRATQQGRGMEETAELGNVATRLLLENDRVKVWEMVLEPGESSDLHRHTLDYILYILEGTSIDADRPDGQSFSFPVKPGQVIFVERGGIERAVNRSDVRFRELLVELKDGR